MMTCMTLFFIAFMLSKSYATNPHYRLQITPSGKVFFKVGESFQLNCLLIPIDAKIFPLRVTLPINSPSLNGRINIEEEPNNLTITLRSLHVNDTGWYNCEASDATSPIRQSIYVTIQAEHVGDCPANTYFSCGNRLCIPKRYICDGFTDCPNDKDESPEICGVNPCDNKISCEDGRCIDKSLCCLRQLDPSCPVTNLVSCCADYLEQLATIRPVNDIALKDNLIRSTVYTISSCAVAVFFFIAILIVAIYRVHMRRRILVRHQTRNNGSPINHHSFGSNAQQNSDLYASNEMFEPLDPIDLDLAYNHYENDDIMQCISQIPKPPIYSEALNHPIMPYNEPPPPYSPRVSSTPPTSPLVLSEAEATSSTSEAPEESYVLVIPIPESNRDEPIDENATQNTYNNNNCNSDNSDEQTSQ
ncbi:low-density lipoprotein receptor class A domain-containing protein 3-like [Oppia nitens]|uniref:low-density lipoprotein receptor class A domain-containing protein 3-like n=1 Tax=Oppia nitens TaxID=1686743 RepID=UPI0023DB8DF2|nr:low-density lipoprotein receptor class A domain-containing protein 3-like [Oppia nitens]